ncbi:unnamed protein product, partial [Lymnaea stagnalis]
IPLSTIDLDLSENSITSVDDNSFIDMPKLLSLSLSCNALTNVNGQMFTGLTKLRLLNLSLNDISFVPSTTFDDMVDLLILDISNNPNFLNNNATIDPRTFKSLNNLQEIYIHVLGISAQEEKNIGPDVSNLLHLQTLIISGFCNKKLISETFFNNVPYIVSLKIVDCQIVFVHPNAFSALKSLENLTLNNLQPYYTIFQLLLDLKCLRNSSLQYLSMININALTTTVTLNQTHAAHLRYINLIQLDMSYNKIDLLTPEFVSLLPRSLKKIDLSGNNFSPDLLFCSLNFPKGLSMDQISKRQMYVRLNQKPSVLLETGLAFKNRTHSFQSSPNQSLGFSLPPNLKILKGNSFNDFGNSIFFIIENTLLELSLSGSFLQFWGMFLLPKGIKKADFSNNYCEVFKAHFFSDGTSLEYLTVADNLLGSAFAADVEGKLFAKAQRLKYLDVSRNRIHELNYDVFKELVHLQILNISENSIQIFNVSFQHMTQLSVIDVSRNSISWLSKNTRDELDDIATQHMLYLDLTSNPLPCTCEGLEILQWLSSTNVYLLNSDFLECRNEENQLQEIGDVRRRVVELKRKCASKSVIILTCIFSIIVFIVILAASLIYRYRWKLRYFWSIALVKVIGIKPKTNGDGFRFDAYLLYTDETRDFVIRDCVRELEEKRGHRLCIEDRDFLPGTYIISNIVSGVQNSTKTVPVLTAEFYQGEYAEYGVKMALMEEIFAHRSVIYLCIYKPMDDEHISRDLLMALKNNRYIEYPPLEEATEEIKIEFWNQFSRVIGNDNNQH